jgi:predicted ATPase
MIESLSIRGFKGYGESTRIPLRGLTVLIGQNGTGKTTILQALDLLGGLVRGSLTEYLKEQGWSYNDLPHLFASKQRPGMTAEFSSGLSWDLELGPSVAPGLLSERIWEGDREFLWRRGRSMRRTSSKGKDESIEQSFSGSWLRAIDASSERDKRRFPELSKVADWAARIRNYLFLDPLALRKSARLGEDIGRSGEQLAGFLGRLKRRDPGALERIKERVARHYPRLQEIDVKQGSYGWTNLLVKERWGKSSAKFNARQASDGLLRLIAVASLYELETPPSILLLDEIENGLHPSILEGFVGMLQELADESDGATQVIATSHSVLALNFVGSPEQVLLVHRDRDGFSRVTPVTSLPTFEKLRRHFDLGEMIYNVGEDRLLKGT